MNRNDLLVPTRIKVVVDSFCSKQLRTQLELTIRVGFVLNNEGDVLILEISRFDDLDSNNTLGKGNKQTIDVHVRNQRNDHGVWQNTHIGHLSIDYLKLGGYPETSHKTYGSDCVA